MVGTATYLLKAFATVPNATIDLLIKCSIELGHFSGALACVIAASRSV